MKLKSSLKQQQGVALITALIITSVAVSLATLMIYRQQIQIRLSSNISTLEQNYQYAYGMEDFAGTILKASWEDQRDFVSFNDPWYSESGLVLPITGGLMTGKLHDLQARININSLIRPRIEKPSESTSVGAQTEGNTSTQTQDTNQQNNPTPNQQNTSKQYDDIATITKERLNRLLTFIDSDQEMGPPENFSVILRDWIDKDQNNGQFTAQISNKQQSQPPINENDLGNGAETPFYQSQETAYYSANTEMISPTELRLIKNMKEKFYLDLFKDITTLPILNGNTATETGINVNTASDKVLSSLGFPPDAVENIIETRKEQPFTTLDEFKELVVVNNVLITENNTEGLVSPLDIGVNSEYFLLEGKIEINNTRLFVNSILWRNKNGQVSVIMRDFTNPQTISKAIN